MSFAELVLRANLTKWQTLPAGERRQHVQILLKLSDRDLAAAYGKFIPFWEAERGWEYARYASLFADCDVVEFGSGLGYDGIVLSRSARSWTFCDIVEDNLALVRRISQLYGRSNVRFEHLKHVVGHVFPRNYDGFFAHGVLHHVPFRLARQEVANLNKYLNPGAHVVLLMYPYERWKGCGMPGFDHFGTMTDGEGTPWAEYYDEAKVQKLIGSDYSLQETIRWGHQNAEFVNFELIKRGDATRK